jgi:hypothetical protein
MYRRLGDMPADVTYVDPNINYPQPDPLSSLLDSAQAAAVRQLPVDFPAVLAQAKQDYQVLRAGLDNGVPIDQSTLTQITDWFRDFPRYWTTIRPNYVPDYTTVVSAHQAALLDDADAFAAQLTGDHTVQTGLGIGPLIIAGILVAAVAGVAGVIWAIGYVKSQNNISQMITDTVAGKLPPDILKKAIDKSQEGSSWLTDIEGILKWGAIAIVGIMVLPRLLDLLPSRKTTSA